MSVCVAEIASLSIILAEFTVICDHFILSSVSAGLNSHLPEDLEHFAHNTGCISEHLVWNDPPSFLTQAYFFIMIPNQSLISIHKA